MQDMLSYLIARDTMHQQQWLGDRRDGAEGSLPIRTASPQQRSDRVQLHVHGHRARRRLSANLRCCEGASRDGRGAFPFRGGFERLGQEPVLGPARPDSGEQMKQMNEPPGTNPLG